MLKNLFVLTAFFLGISNQALAITPAQFEALQGRYEGKTWSASESDEITCIVDIYVNEKNQVVINLADKNGIPFYTRNPDGRTFSKIILPQIQHPKQRLGQFLKNTKENPANQNNFYNEVKKSGFSTTEFWRLTITNLDKEYGFIQINYKKYDTWKIYDSTLAYTNDLTGCYKLKKIAN